MKFRLGLFCLERFERAILFGCIHFCFVLNLSGKVGNGRLVSGKEMMQETIEQQIVGINRKMSENSK